MTGDGARAGRAVALAVAMVIGALGLLLVPSPVATSANPTRSTTTSTTLSPTTSANLLVPGDGTQGAELTTTTVATATKVNAGGPSDGMLIALVIVGLVLIAGVVCILTWRYWVATRPPLRDRDTASTSAG